MKIDLFKWQEVDPLKTYEITSGKVHVMCSKDTAVFVAVEGYEILAGVGTDIRAEMNTPLINVSFQAPKGARVFIYEPTLTPLTEHGEIFTNIDRQPMESGSVLEVRKAVRQLALDQMHTRRALRAEREALERERKAREKPPEPESVPEPAPEPASEPAADGGA